MLQEQEYHKQSISTSKVRRQIKLRTSKRWQDCTEQMERAALPQTMLRSCWQPAASSRSSSVWAPSARRTSPMQPFAFNDKSLVHPAR